MTQTGPSKLHYNKKAGDYLLQGKLYEFGEVDGASIQTKISLQVELVDRKTNRNVWDRLAEHEEPVSGKTVADVVQSLDRNLQRVVSETAVEVDKFLATRTSCRAMTLSHCNPSSIGWRCST